MTTMTRFFLYLTALVLSTSLLSACSTPQHSDHKGILQACPSAPHCVSSLEQGSDKYIAPISVQSEADWLRLQQLLLAMPRTDLATKRDNYLHAVATSAIMRFKDDIELVYSKAQNRVDVRSSSRTGYYDFDVNRQRIESLRAQFNAAIEK
ncbi:DUF1499 domain-containing protein [Zhongshania marina]|uniref:DUF1499 domain-containing protein n=1 Tax=Zhongshania marina TaxID=2304603 RepID=A0A2S4HCM5_9GAMM|nr:DUF1499 domain-containing protein [Marortus luteolus]POP51756.1 DUF1499 domain-containing protein [Marortus luteolus]